jgi:undecaprenyl-diphosphatase
MDWLQALILGIIEGVTEYLPVSSTGHLLIAERVLSIGKSDAADAFAICIQGGAIMAVLGLYWKRVLSIGEGVMGKNPEGLRLGINILVAVVPAILTALTLGKKIKEHLFGEWPVVIAWFVGGVAILVVSAFVRNRRETGGERKDLAQLAWTSALLIGCAQCVAMWPGTSRSLVTIVAGVLVGLRLASAVEFSFLVGVVTLGAATAYDALKHGKEMLTEFGALPLVIGFVAAWISAVFAVKWMVGYLNRHGMEIFGWYRIVIALAAAVWLIYFSHQPPAIQ